MLCDPCRQGGLPPILLWMATCCPLHYAMRLLSTKQTLPSLALTLRQNLFPFPSGASLSARMQQEVEAKPECPV